MEETQDRRLPLVYSSNPDFNMIQNEADESQEALFNEDAMIETPFGFGEGYFRHLKVTPEYLKWKTDKEENYEGMWKKEEKYSKLPWPLIKKGGVPHYFNKFLEKLEKTESNLFQLGSFLPENQEMECLLCNYDVPRSSRGHFVLNLDAYEPKTELRWPSIYYHYLHDHGVLPSRMFVTIFLEHRP